MKRAMVVFSDKKRFFHYNISETKATIKKLFDFYQKFLDGGKSLNLAVKFIKQLMELAPQKVNSPKVRILADN